MIILQTNVLMTCKTYCLGNNLSIKEVGTIDLKLLLFVFLNSFKLDSLLLSKSMADDLSSNGKPAPSFDAFIQLLSSAIVMTDILVFYFRRLKIVRVEPRPK